MANVPVVVSLRPATTSRALNLKADVTVKAFVIPFTAGNPSISKGPTPDVPLAEQPRAVNGRITAVAVIKDRK
jgi:hypothetical protein